jgi:hypothetical protein
MAILSFFYFQKSALETAFAFAMYSCVEVFIQTHFALLLKHLELKCIYLVDNKNQKSGD